MGLCGGQRRGDGRCGPIDGADRVCVREEAGDVRGLVASAVRGGSAGHGGVCAIERGERVDGGVWWVQWVEL